MKSMKKLVLVGLVLLASVVVLTGCDTPLEPESTTVNEQAGGSENDSVPEVPKYTVKFDTAHGTTPASITVESGTKLTAEQLQALPDTADDIFEGWYDGETQAKGGEYTVSKDVTLVARWRNRDTVASVTFAPSSTTFYYGKSVPVTLSTTTDGATIHYQLGDEEWKIYNEAIPITSDTTITAYATKAGLKDSAETTATYTVRKLTGISITPPTRTVYSVGELFDSIGMEVIATYDDESSREVTGWTTDFDVVTSEKGVNKTVTVSYREGDVETTDTFTVDVAYYKFTETVQDADSSYTGTMSGGTYIKFGDWPQTIKADGVTVYETKSREMGMFTAYLGSDGNYYVKSEEKADGSGEEYKYSDGTQAGQDGTNTQWFKVEPIVWRVLTEDYKVPGENEEPQSTKKALLLAENILTGGIKWANSKNNYMESNIRKWLNGNSGSGAQSDYNGGAGFLQTAFTPEAQGLITPTTVDNSARSTNPDSNATLWNSGKNEYACGDTEDKIFLLSEQEATKSDYGFAEYNVCVGDSKGTTTSTRIRVTTDYAKATGAYQSATAGYGGWWWLRSPHYRNESHARRIHNDGNASNSINVSNLKVGIVPALSISINGN